MTTTLRTFPHPTDRTLERVTYGPWTYVRHFNTRKHNQEYRTHLQPTDICPVDLGLLNGRAVIYHDPKHPISARSFGNWVRTPGAPLTCPQCRKDIDLYDFGAAAISKSIGDRVAGGLVKCCAIMSCFIPISYLIAYSLIKTQDHSDPIIKNLEIINGITHQHFAIFGTGLLIQLACTIMGRVENRVAVMIFFGGFIMSMSSIPLLYVDAVNAAYYSANYLIPKAIEHLPSSVATAATTVSSCIGAVKGFFGW